MATELLTTSPETALRVVVVDDNGVDCFLHEAALSEAYPDAEVHCYQDARLAVQCLTDLSEQPDVLLLDVNMPVFSGWDVLEWLQLTVPDLPVVMVSSSQHPDDLARSAQFRGVRGYLSKPLTPDKLKPLELLPHRARTAMDPGQHATA